MASSPIHRNPNFYPEHLASYQEVLSNQTLFMTTLQQLHSVLGIHFMIPIVGGSLLDVHKLFVEVTSRGGLEKTIAEKTWRKVITSFSFPPTATNASSRLRSYYDLHLYHYEQAYFFRASGQIPLNPFGPQIQATEFDQLHSDSTDSPRAASAVGGQVDVLINGKFDSGYLVTVVMGSETLNGVLYQMPYGVQTPSGTKRRKRRCKRDPAHPGKHRETTRMIGESGSPWNALNDQQKSVYEEKAAEDKERYKEKLITDQLIYHAVPIQQIPPQEDVETQNADTAMQDAEQEEGDDSSEKAYENNPEDEMAGGSVRSPPRDDTPVQIPVSEPVKEKE